MPRLSPKIAFVTLIPGLLLATALAAVATLKPVERTGVTILLDPSDMKVERREPAQLPIPNRANAPFSDVETTRW